MNHFEFSLLDGGVDGFEHNSNCGGRDYRGNAEPAEELAHFTVIIGVSTTILSFAT